MTAPTQYPDWATVATQDPISGTPNLVQPSPQLQAEGYFTGDIPAANNFNWMLNLQGLWIRYLAGTANQVASLVVRSSNGAAAPMLPNSGTSFLAFASNEAGSYALAVGYNALLTGVPTLTPIGSGTITISPTVGGVLSAADIANPTSPLVLVVVSAGS